MIQSNAIRLFIGLEKLGWNSLTNGKLKERSMIETRNQINRYFDTF